MSDHEEVMSLLNLCVVNKRTSSLQGDIEWLMQDHEVLDSRLRKFESANAAASAAPTLLGDDPPAGSRQNGWLRISRSQLALWCSHLQSM